MPQLYFGGVPEKTRCEMCNRLIEISSSEGGLCWWCVVTIMKKEVKYVPKIDTPTSGEFAPFITPDILGAKGEAKAVIETPHRLIESTGNNVIDVKVGKTTYSFSLNKTNTSRLIEQHGDNSDSWVGKPITLVRVMANNPQTKKEVPAIRVKQVE